MFSVAVALTVLCASVGIARADPNPTTPDSTDVYNAGSPCQIAWDADTTGKWTKMYIELMTGTNLAMVHLTTVATVDATTTTSFSWTCPEVTPNAPIYFYQFSSPASTTRYWTTRWAIADASGKTTPAPNATQPGSNDPIPWGLGQLVNEAAATPAPTDVGSQAGSTTPGASGAPASTPAGTPGTPAASTTPAAGPVSVTSGGAAQGAPATSSYKSGPAPSGSAAANGTAGGSASGAQALGMGAAGRWMVVALGVASAGFVFAL